MTRSQYICTAATLVEWFQKMEIPNLVTDTIASEVSIDPESGLLCRSTMP